MPGISTCLLYTSSYIGFEPVEMVWKGGDINVTMQEDNKTLNEVVVGGFGTQKKVNLTGAVSTVDAKTLGARPVNSVVDALQGAVAGMNSVSYTHLSWNSTIFVVARNASSMT